MRTVIIAAFLVLTSLSYASATLIDFSSDTLGVKANGFSSVSTPDVRFYDTIGNDLTIGAYYPESNGSNALAVFGDDQSKLKMTFAKQADFLSLQFGNDQPGWDVSHAVLDLYLGNALVGNSTVAVNKNDYMDQTISFGGTVFDNAIFYYSNAGNPANLIEVVDNINFSEAAPVPEPSSVLLLTAGIAGIGFWRQKRRA